MGRFKSSGHAQRFLSAFGIISSYFRVGRHLYTARAYKELMISRSHYGMRLFPNKSLTQASGKT
jgi:hypothetical protein